MFDTWTDAKFKLLYEACQAGILAGSRLIRWKAGDTEAEKELTVNLADPNVLAAVNAEFRQRFPSEVGRPRYSRTRAVFS